MDNTKWEPDCVEKVPQKNFSTFEADFENLVWTSQVVFLKWVYFILDESRIG